MTNLNDKQIRRRVFFSRLWQNRERHSTSDNNGYEVPFPSVTAPKLLLLVATSHIRRTLYEIPNPAFGNRNTKEIQSISFIEVKK